MDRQRLSQAHLYVLNNTTEVIPYIDSHKKTCLGYSPKNEAEVAAVAEEKEAHSFEIDPSQVIYVRASGKVYSFFLLLLLSCLFFILC